MNRTVSPGPRSGSVRIPASKSQAHRLLICAALGREQTTIFCDGMSDDILATADCLRALGAEIREEPGALAVTPIRRVPGGLCRLPCRESGSTLRFLLPVTGALGAEAVFLREGRLPERPLAPLDRELTRRGMRLSSAGAELFCSGRLAPAITRSPATYPASISPAFCWRCPSFRETAALPSRDAGNRRPISP